MKFLAVGLALLALTAQAEESLANLAVLPLFTPPELEALGREVTALMDEEARRITPSAQDGRSVRAALGEAGYEQARGCQARPDCLTQKLAQVPAARVVTGSLERDETRYRLRLFLIQLSGSEAGSETDAKAEAKVLASVDRTIPIASRRFAKDVTALVPRLMRGETEALGTLRLRANVAGARVFVDEQLAGTLPAKLRVEPGKHLVRVERERHLPVEQWVAVESGAETEASFRLLLAPGAAPDGALPGVQVSHAGIGVWLGRPWPVWLFAGGTVLSAATGVGFALDAHQRASRVRDAYDPSSDTYLLPRSEAVLGRRNARLANTFFLIAGASALVTGVLYFALPAGSAGEARQVALSLEPDGAGASVLFRGRL